MMFKPSHILVSLQAAHLESVDFELGHHPLGGRLLSVVSEKTEKKDHCLYWGDYKGGKSGFCQALLTEKLLENSNQRDSNKLPCTIMEVL